MAESSFVIQSSKLQNDLDAAGNASSGASSEKSLSEFASTILSSIGSSVEAPLCRDVSISTFLPLEDVEMPSFCDLTSCDEVLHLSTGSSSLHQSHHPSLTPGIHEAKGGTSSDYDDFSNIFVECQNLLDILNQNPNDTSPDTRLGILDLDQINDSLVTQTPKCKQSNPGNVKRSSKYPQMSTPKETKATDVGSRAKATADTTFTAEEQAKSSSILVVQGGSPQEGGNMVLDSTFIKTLNVSYTLEKKVATINTTFEAKPPPETVFNSTFDKPGINSAEMHDGHPSKALNLTFDAQKEADQSHNHTFEVVGKGLFVIEGKTTNLMDMQSNDLQTIFTPVKNTQGTSRHSTPITRTSHQTASKDPLKSSLLKRSSLVSLQPKSSVERHIENKENHSDALRIEPLPSLELMRRDNGQFRIKTSAQSRTSTNGPVKAVAVPDAVKALACRPSSPTISNPKGNVDCLQDIKGPASTPEVYRLRGIGGGPLKTSTPSLGYNHHSQSNLDLVSGVTPIKKQMAHQYSISSGEVDNVINGPLSFSRESTVGELNSKTPDSYENAFPITGPQRPDSDFKPEDADNIKAVVPLNDCKREQSETAEERHSISNQIPPENYLEERSQKLPDDLKTEDTSKTKVEGTFSDSKQEQSETAEGLNSESDQNPPKVNYSGSSGKAVTKSRVLSRRSLKSLQTLQPKPNLTLKRTNSLKLNPKLKAGEVLTKANHDTSLKKLLNSKPDIQKNSQTDTTYVNSASVESVEGCPDAGSTSTGLVNKKQTHLAANRKTVVNKKQTHLAANRQTVVNKNQAALAANRKTVVDKNQAALAANRKTVVDKNQAGLAANRKTPNNIAPPPQGSNIRPPLKPINKVNAKSAIVRNEPPKPAISQRRISAPPAKPVFNHNKANTAAIDQRRSSGHFQPPKKFNSLSSNKENDHGAHPKKVVSGSSRPRSHIPMPFAPKQGTVLS